MGLPLSSRSQTVLRIQLTTAAKADLNELGDQLGVPQNRIMTKLIEWLCQQHPGVRNVSLGLVPDDMKSDTARWLIEKI